jgi:hypothetical protein
MLGKVVNDPIATVRPVGIGSTVQEMQNFHEWGFIVPSALEESLGV